MRSLSLYFSVLLLLVGMLLVPGVRAEPSPLAEQQNAASQKQPRSQSGEEVFRANCARCHMPPMSLSTRTTGTVIMHMRVRARLSREDEKLLLKYLAP
jgi:cytochrome c5